MIEPDYSVKFVGDRLKDGKVLFKMQVYDSATKASWNIEARFSTLRDIHKALEARFPKGELPDFPPKGWWYENDKPEFIIKRKKELDNYYNTLFKTMNLNKLPELKEFLESEKPAPPKPKVEAPPVPIAPQPQHHDAVFNEIYEKTVEKFIDLKNEFIIPSDEGSTRKKKAEFQKVKVEGKSSLIQSMRLPQAMQENYMEFWATCYFEERKQCHREVLGQTKRLDFGVERVNQSIFTVITSKVLQ